MLGAAYVEHIHDELLGIFWVSEGTIVKHDVRDRGLLESAAARPFHSAFGQDAYPSVPEKAAALFHSLVSNHPFGDGNKRTAVMALDHFLLANRHLVRLPNTELYQLAKKTASYKKRGLSLEHSLAEIREAISEYVVELDLIRSGARHNPVVAGLYRELDTESKKIRRSRMNRLVPSA